MKNFPVLCVKQTSRTGKADESGECSLEGIIDELVEDTIGPIRGNSKIDR